MYSRIKTVVILGGGTAGRMTGQRAVFNYLGIAEEEWMRECNAQLLQDGRQVYQLAHTRVG